MLKPTDKQIEIAAIIVLLTIIAIACLASCNVTRTITTEARHWQRGDTTVTIVTKTTESYDATKKLLP